MFDDYPDFEELTGIPPEWDTPKEITAHFNQTDFIFAKGVFRSLDDQKTGQNNNIAVIGTSGCGKTTSYIEPNLFNPAGCYVISDPKGTLLRKYQYLLESHGYNIIVIDFQHPEKSVRWNPLRHIRTTQDILRITNSLIFDPRAVCCNDPFWDNADILFLNALIGYMLETNYQPRNFRGILKLMNDGDRFTRRIEKNGFRQSDDKASQLADRMELLYQHNPNSWAYEQFRSANQATDKTYDSIRVTLASKFAQYTSREVEEMMSDDEIDFAQIAQERTAVFVLQSDYDRSLDGLVNLFFSQAINSLIEYADSCENQRLPIPVRFFLDDYGATTAIDNLDTIISTIRSRAISVSLILQSEAQLTNSRKPGADKTILANCDTYIYMGGNDVETAKAVSQRCNKPLEQVLYMPVGHCWVFQRGKKPVYAEIADRPDLTEYAKEHEQETPCT